MKTETCIYSGYKIYPGHGRRMVRVDGRVNIFLSAKCERSWRLKRNPRKISWTVLYRRKHKKGTMAEEITKRRTRKTQKFQRAIASVPLAEIMAKRNQKPEVRAAQREAAIKAAKEKTRAVKATKKVEKTKTTKQPSRAKAARPTKGAAPRVGGKR